MAGLFESKQGWSPITLEMLYNMQNYQQTLQNGGNAIYNPYEVDATASARNMLAKGIIDQDEYDNLIGASTNVQKARSYTQEQINQRALGDVTNTLEYAKTHPGFASDNGSQGWLWDALDIVGAATLATGLAVAGSAMVQAATGGTSAAAGAGGGSAAGAAGAGIGEGALAGGSAAAGASGGATLAELGGAAAATGAAEAAIPQVIISGSAAGAGAGAGLGAIGTAGAIGGGLTMADVLNGTGANGGSSGISDEGHLPEGVPLEGTEMNEYPNWSPEGTGSWSLNDLKNGYDIMKGLNSLGNIVGGVTDYRNNQYNKDYYKGIIDKLNGMYAYGTPEEQLMRGKIEAQDAASGRRSQYGIREMNLAGMLAQQRANIMTSPVYSSYVNAYTGRQDNSYNSLLAALGNQTGGSSSGSGFTNTVNNLGNLYNTGSKMWDYGKNLANSLFGG